MDKQFSPVKYALISAVMVTTGFIIWVLWNISTPIPKSTSGIWLVFLPPFATLVGIGTFLVSWSVITIFTFLSSKYRSTLPKKKLFLQTLLSILILIITLVSAYAFLTRQLLFREAKSPQTSQAHLLEIYTKAMEKCNMEKCDFEILQRLAENPQTPVQILENIYTSYGRHSSNSVSYYLAKNKNTPSYILEELAKNSHWTVRSPVAENPNTPIEVLRTLADDEDYLVRASVAQNPNVTRDILIKLKSDANWQVSRSANSSWKNKEFDRKLE